MTVKQSAKSSVRFNRNPQEKKLKALLQENTCSVWNSAHPLVLHQVKNCEDRQIIRKRLNLFGLVHFWATFPKGKQNFSVNSSPDYNPIRINNMVQEAWHAVPIINGRTLGIKKQPPPLHAMLGCPKNTFFPDYFCKLSNGALHKDFSHIGAQLVNLQLKSKNFCMLRVEMLYASI